MGIFGSIIGGIGGALLAPFTGGLSIPVGAGIGDSIENSRDAKKANAQKTAQYNQQMALARQQFQFQQDYAKNRLQWQVEDAKKAGLHPMVAAGLSPTSFSPVSTPSIPDMSSVASDLGQNLDYAVTKAKTQKQQLEALDFMRKSNQLDLEGKHLDNELKQMEIMSMLSRLTNSGPAAPDVTGSGVGMIGGQQDSLPVAPEKAGYIGEPEIQFNPTASDPNVFVMNAGNDVTGLWEDKDIAGFIPLDMWPIIKANAIDYGARLRGQIVNGMVYSNARRGWVSVNGPYGKDALADRFGFRSFRDAIRSVTNAPAKYDYYGNSYRY